MFEELSSWAKGVVTGIEPDLLPLDASPRGRNSALVSIGGGLAVVAKRKGCRRINPSKLSYVGQSAITAQMPWRKLSGTVYYLVYVNGQVYSLDPDGTTATLPNTHTTPLAGGTLFYPSWVVAKDFLFYTVPYGQPRRVVEVTSNQVVLASMGLTRPASGPVASGTASSTHHMNGTYEGVMTFYNAATGLESSRSDATAYTTGAGNEEILWDWTGVEPTDADPYYTHVRLYLRKTTIGQIDYFLVAEVDITTASSYSTDLTDQQMTALTETAPGDAQNDPPPTNITIMAWYADRLFVTAGDVLYYSQVSNPEAFNLIEDYEPLNEGGGKGPIIAMAPTEEALIVFREDCTYAIIGTDPLTWTVQLIDPDNGCIAPRSVSSIEGKIFFWNEHQGPMVRVGAQGAATPMAYPTFSPTVSRERLNLGPSSNFISRLDTTNQRIVWAVASPGQLVNNTLLPFNYRLGVWESDGWQMVDVVSMEIIEDGTALPQVYIGGAEGQIWRMNDSDIDGVPAGSATGGTFTPLVSGETTIITDLTAVFDTTTGLEGLYLYLLDTDGSVLRRKITTNSPTTITLERGVTVTASTPYTFYLGAIDFQWDTAWMNEGSGFSQKRYEYLYFAGRSTAGVPPTISLDLFYNLRELVAETRTLTMTDDGPLYDAATSIYDVTSFGEDATRVTARQRLSRVGECFKVRVRHLPPNTPLTLQRIALQSTVRSVQVGTT